MISIKQLKYLDAVSRFGHFGKAATHCAVTQPALSMQIQELEKDLGIQLVERHARGASLPEAGREIARRANRILTEVLDIADYARQCSKPLSAPIRFGVIPTVAPYVLPPLLPLLRQHYPQLDVHVRETHTEQLIAELLEGLLDVLMLALPVQRREIETLRLFEDRFLLALPPDRHVHGRIRATSDLVKNDRLLLLEEGHCLRDQALAFCGLRQVDSLDLETKHGKVKILRFTDPEPMRVLGLAWRSTSPRRRDFIDLGKLIVEAVPKAARSAKLAS